ncbi:Bacterial regulatory protein, luxR family [compost metagenome]
MARFGRTALALTPNGEQVVLSLKTQPRNSTLAPREMTAAMLFADGHSYKEIAKILGLTPATVRTYLRNCYLQLGVSSKIELGSVLRAAATCATPARPD